MPVNSRLDQFLSFRSEVLERTPGLAQTILALAEAAGTLAGHIDRGAAYSPAGDIASFALRLFEERLRDAQVSMLEAGDSTAPRVRDSGMSLALTLLPMEGSAGMDVAMACSSTFSIHALDSGASSGRFSRDSLQAAGLVVYGPQTLFMLGLDDGVSLFSFDRARQTFVLSRTRLQLPARHCEMSIDAANYRFWNSGIRHFFDACIAGTDGPLGADYELRWNASLALEAARILGCGGIYLYPDDIRAGFEHGKHDLLHEAFPIAFLVEKAGGKAVDGFEAILDRPVTGANRRVPLIFGSSQMVDQVLEYFQNDPTDTLRFPLFEYRSLLRS